MRWLDGGLGPLARWRGNLAADECAESEPDHAAEGDAAQRADQAVVTGTVVARQLDADGCA